MLATLLLIKRWIYLILVTVTALAIEVMSADGQSYWVVWTALSLSLITTGITFFKRLRLMALTGLLLAITSLMASILAMYYPLLIIYIGVLTLLCASLAVRKSQYFYPLLIINLFTLMAGMLPAAIPGSVDRGCAILIGTTIACVYSVIFFPYFMRHELRACILLELKYLSLLAEDIFACFLQPDYVDHIYLFERRMHHQKSRCIHMLQQAYKIKKMSARDAAMVKSLEQIFEILLSCSLLRFRVTDLTIFAVCAVEMGEVADAINANIQEMMNVFRHKNPFMNTQGLKDKIERFEENYQSVLQVTAREPLVFLLFIASLKALQEEIEHFNERKTHAEFE